MPASGKKGVRTMRTPWGMSDHVVDYGNGIKFYGTPSHGGFKIPKKLNNQIPEYMRNENGWYEEDCEWSIPVVVGIFPSENRISALDGALHTFKQYFWQEYERFVNVVIPEGESWSKDEFLFIERNKNNYVVVSAVNSDRFKEMVECYAIRGGRNHDGQYASNDEIHILIPEHEYDKRDRLFVVKDPEKYQKCPK